MKKYVMALDQGTTSSRCILFNKSGEIASMAQKEFTQIYPKEGWVEHDPVEIWATQSSVAIEAMATANATAEDIAAIGITNQRETTIIWDKKTGKPIYNAIVWQCHRTSDIIDEMVKKGWSDKVREKTGLVPDAYFSASKIAWILDHVEGARQRAKKGELAFGTVDTWLMWNLSMGRIHATDYTNASRTMLFNIKELKWDEEIMGYFDIPMEIMPQVHPSGYDFGVSDAHFFGGEVPICGVAGDQQAALFGQCCFEKGDAKNTYGTGCFLLMNTGSEVVYSSHGLVTTIAAGRSEKPQYALEGSVFVGGAVIQWLRDGMRMIKNAAQSEEYADNAKDTCGVYIVPSFTGLGAPYWNQEARGIVVGLTRGCEKEHFIRASLESIAYQVSDVIKAMEEDLGENFTELKVDGGASANSFLMKFQANILGSDIIRPRCIETTALGAAYLAGLTTGYWADEKEIKDNWQLDRKFYPDIDDERKEELLKEWNKAVKTALFWADED